ncbi:MAG: hypothetical protein E6G91_20280 [Alphaproteobacteria bacterium]|nr:MAG: hypothetical protein E6G91_20280 [Alphaproteobacteria bacterium]
MEWVLLQGGNRHLAAACGTFTVAFGWKVAVGRRTGLPTFMEATLHGLIYLIGLIVVIMAILSFFGLR